MDNCLNCSLLYGSRGSEHFRRTKTSLWVGLKFGTFVKACNTTGKTIVNQEIQRSNFPLLPHTCYATDPNQLVGAPTNWWGPPLIGGGLTKWWGPHQLVGACSWVMGPHQWVGAHHSWTGSLQSPLRKILHVLKKASKIQLLNVWTCLAFSVNYTKFQTLKFRRHKTETHFDHIKSESDS